MRKTAIFKSLLMILVMGQLLWSQNAGTGFNLRSVTGGDISNQEVIGVYSAFDMDSDGNGEFIVVLEEGGATGADDVIIFESSTDNTYSKVWGVNLGDDPGDGSGVSSVTTGDSDGDGKLEVIVAQEDPDNILIYEYSGLGQITDGSNPSETAMATLSISQNCSGILVADLDGDNNNEITVGSTSTSNGLYLFETDGDNSYASAITIDVTAVGQSGSDGSANICGPSDFDGDGTLEVAVAGRNGELMIYNFNGTSWTQEWHSGSGLNDEGDVMDGQRISFGNIDNSGRDEIIISTQRDDEIYVFEGTGNNTYAKDATDETIDNVSTNIYGLAIGDYDADGQCEIYYTDASNFRYREHNTGSDGSYDKTDFGSEQDLVTSCGSIVLSIGFWMGTGNPYLDGDLFRDIVCTKIDGDNDEIIILESATQDVSLPVELISFTARSERGAVVLEWVTESEIENLGFLLERRRNGGMEEWKEIANYIDNPELQGQGSETGRTEYQFVDNTVEVGKTYDYRLADVSYDGVVEYHSLTVMGVEVAEFPIEFALLLAYPNPFNPATTISYNLIEDGNVTLTIFDINGREVSRLVEEMQSSGEYELFWDASHVSSGVYFCRLVQGNHVSTQKLILLK